MVGVKALLLFLSIVLVSAIDDHGIHCSRARSRTARKNLEEYLLPFLEMERFNLSTKCRLHPDNDVFREQEKEKDFIHTGQWRCGYCQKMFESENYLDLHFDNRHSEMLNVTRENCLADLCGALHCDYMEHKEKHIFSKVKCGPSVDRNRHMCEKLANSCFPPQQSTAATRLNDFFMRQFCDAHTCKRDRKYFPRGSGNVGNQSIYYAFSFFTFLIVIFFYVGLYFYKRETILSVNTMKRLSQVKHPKKH